MESIGGTEGTHSKEVAGCRQEAEVVKVPKARGTPIGAIRMRDWLADFSGYRVNVNEGRIDRWMNQFRDNHRDVAARVLDSVDFITNEQISEAYRQALRSLPGWHMSQARRRGKWRFVPFSFSAGESGDSMLHMFRVANALQHRRYDECFIHIRDLPGAGLGEQDAVVFVDDFSGTGDQAIRNWNSALAELLPERPSAFLVLVAASAVARNRIKGETELTPVLHTVLRDADNLFHERCKCFSADEKNVILEYCRIAAPREPKGYGECGFVVVFSHSCPSNSIPILHVSNQRWEGLFRRQEMA
jgi:hypothetical protein